jgi:hypothetical protein
MEAEKVSPSITASATFDDGSSAGEVKVKPSSKSILVSRSPQEYSMYSESKKGRNRAMAYAASNNKYYQLPEIKLQTK